MARLRLAPLSTLTQTRYVLHLSVHGVVGPAVGVIARSGFVFGFRRLDSGEAEEDEAFAVGEVQDVAGLSERGERGEAPKTNPERAMTPTAGPTTPWKRNVRMQAAR
jgi:hypothetical protein